MMSLLVNKMEYVLTITRIIATIIVTIIVQLIHIIYVLKMIYVRIQEML